MDALMKVWPWLMAGTHLALGAVAAGHAVMFKRDSRAAIGWVGLIALAPLVGSLLYFTLGINRIRRRGTVLQQPLTHVRRRLHEAVSLNAEVEQVAHEFPHYLQLHRLISDVTQLQLLEGNRLEPLVNGEQAYPAMLEAIDTAKESISLCSYIFDNDATGAEFIDALDRAKSRGVQVRVLVDAVGARYSRPTSLSVMTSRGLPCAPFLKTRIVRLFKYANLRSHRKILVVDGRVGFTGGMNIREGCRLDRDPAHPIQDLHFRVQGPVVNHLQRVFASDWAFTTGEVLDEAQWFPEQGTAGKARARGLAHGPDEDFEVLQITIQGALAVAQKSVSICTPYFLPDASIISALRVAAMRGVDVRILLPARNNIKLVHWASRALWWQILEKGCRIYLSPPPFDHTKLMLVDDLWSLVGSSNRDPRALRLNFEFNVECYDAELNQALTSLFEGKLRAATEVTYADVERRGTVTRLLDGSARLLSPYL